MREVVRKISKKGRYAGIFEKEEAVSPVIATILMVAITVVLAATVYILVSHYTSVGAATPLTASMAEVSEGGGNVIFSLTLSTPSNITTLSDISLKVSGANISAPLVLTYTAGTKGATGTAAYWDGKYTPTSSSNTYYFEVVFSNTNGINAGYDGSIGYVASGATLSLYVFKGGIVAPGQTGAPTPASGSTTTLATGWSMSGITVTMTVSGNSGSVSGTAP